MISGRNRLTTYDATLNLKPGTDLFGHRRAAQDVASLEHDDTRAGAREVRGAGQAVMSAADDDGVVLPGPSPPVTAVTLASRKALRPSQCR